MFQNTNREQTSLEEQAINQAEIEHEEDNYCNELDLSGHSDERGDWLYCENCQHILLIWNNE